MKLAEKQNYDFPNYGIPHESNLNLIGMILSSRRVSHSLPVDINIDPITFAEMIGPDDREFMNSIYDLWNVVDSITIKHRHVHARVMILNRVYKIVFLCYSD